MGFYQRQIDKALQGAREIDTKLHTKIAIFSDCHRGNGTRNDSFLQNKTLYQAALHYYDEGGFTCIELGDGDELWENRRFSSIFRIHEDVFQQLLKLHLQGRLFLVYGNHDMVKKTPRFAAANPQFALPFYESLILRGLPGQQDIHLIHGHQCDLLNDQFWKTARFLIRYLWKPLELAGFNDPTSAARNYTRKNKTERRMVEWTKTRSASLMAGHTHRPVLSMEPGPAYFNTGSCVHPGSITCFELIYGQLSLIKWTTCVDENRYLYVCRQPIAGPRTL